jgi:hypothetical protein
MIGLGLSIYLYLTGAATQAYYFFQRINKCLLHRIGLCDDYCAHCYQELEEYYRDECALCRPSIQRRENMNSQTPSELMQDDLEPIFDKNTEGETLDKLVNKKWDDPVTKSNVLKHSQE